jgi:hypothetical protein
VEVGGSKRMPWMTGFHGRIIPPLPKKVKKKGFKGAGEMYITCRELRIWQKRYSQMACEPLALPYADLKFIKELFAKRTSSWKTES